MEARQRLEHAYHNESVCYYLDNNGHFNDWVVTSAFYAALHFCCYKIFPIEEKIDGKTYVFNTVEQFKKFHNLELNKHSILSDLIDEFFPSISPIYDELKDYCMNARYFHYKIKTVKANRAKEIVTIIKNSLELEETLPPA